MSLKFTTQAHMAVFCFCSKSKPICLSKMKASSAHEPQLCEIAPVEFGPSPKIYYTMRLCYLFCLCLITEDIQITFQRSVELLEIQTTPKYARIFSVQVGYCRVHVLLSFSSFFSNYGCFARCLSK